MVYCHYGALITHLLQNATRAVAGRALTNLVTEVRVTSVTLWKVWCRMSFAVQSDRAIWTFSYALSMVLFLSGGSLSDARIVGSQVTCLAYSVGRKHNQTLTRCGAVGAAILDSLVGHVAPFPKTQSPPHVIHAMLWRCGVGAIARKKSLPAGFAARTSIPARQHASIATVLLIFFLHVGIHAVAPTVPNACMCAISAHRGRPVKGIYVQFAAGMQAVCASSVRRPLRKPSAIICTCSVDASSIWIRLGIITRLRQRARGIWTA